MTTHVVGSLQDKSSSVRRYAIALLTKLVLTHPFGLLHGGPLNFSEWEGRYEVVSRELRELEKSVGMGASPPPEEAEGEAKEGEEVTGEGEGEDGDEEGDDDAEMEGEEGEEEPMEETADDGTSASQARSSTKQKKYRSKKNARKSLPVDLADASDEKVLAAFDGQKHMKLKLTKKYVADAVAFIRQVEGAAEILAQLLVSTTKAEVLESMEFFKIANEYEMECAEVGRRMTSQRS